MICSSFIIQKAQENLLALIEKKRDKGNSIGYEKSILHQVKVELYKLGQYAKTWTESNVPKFYEKSIKDTNAELISKGVTIKSDTPFSQIHSDAIKIIIDNTTSDLIDANKYVGREVVEKINGVGHSLAQSKQIRTAGLEAIGQKFARGKHRNRLVKLYIIL